MITSIDKDGNKWWIWCAFIKAVSILVSVPIIVSGGNGDLRHIASAIIEGGASSVLLASSLHYNKFSISQIKFFRGKCGTLIRDDYVNLGLYDA